MTTPSTSNHVNIDGDVVVYSVGFASEQKRHRTSDGKLFEEQADADRYVDRYDLGPWEIVKIPEPLEYCLHSVRKLIERIVARCKATSYTVFLTGEGNFREEVAKFQAYKGHREDAKKPAHYDAIRSYILEEHSGKVVIGQEADDALSILAYEEGHTIATIDKDLNNTPGWHYNWQKDELYYVSDHEAWQNFHIQLLTGDATDNIPGLFKYTGVKATAKYKNEVLEAPTPALMFGAVFEAYMDAVEKKDLALSELDVHAFLEEIGQLLWMRRAKGEMYTTEIYSCNDS